MIQWLFFNWINLQRRRSGVTQTVEFSVAIHTNETEARLPGMYVAMARTQETMHPPARFRLPPTRLVERFRLLEDLQIAHDHPPTPSILQADSGGVARQALGVEF